MLGQDYRRVPVVVALPAEIDVTDWKRAYDRLYAALGSGATVVIADFTVTAFCDCGSLRQLVSVQRRAATRGSQLRLAIPPGGAVHRVATLMKLDLLLPVYPSTGEAAAAATPPRPKAPGQPCNAAGRTATGTDIIDLIGADQLHIRRWRTRLSQLLRQRRDRAVRSEASITWDTLAALIDLHMRAEDEICGPGVYGTTPEGVALARQVKDAHEEVRDIVREASLQPVGTPPWCKLAGAALAEWSWQYYYERHGRAGGCRRRADPAVRRHVASQWRSFRELHIRDQYPDAPPWLPTCQLRQDSPATPRLADPAFSPLGCTCQACTAGLTRLPRLP